MWQNLGRRLGIDELSVTTAFIGTCWLAWVWCFWVGHGLGTEGGILGFGAFSNATYYATGVLDTTLVRSEGEWERLIAPIFLHIGFLHIIFNSQAILQIGRLLESCVGRWGTLLALLASGLGGNLMGLLWSSVTGTTQRGAGASGAGCGIAAALIVYLWGLHHAQLAALRAALMRNLVFWLLIGLDPRISGTGHLGGALAGAAVGLLLRKAGGFERAFTSWQHVVRGLALVLLAVFVAAGGVTVVKARERMRTVTTALPLQEYAAQLAEWCDPAAPGSALPDRETAQASTVAVQAMDLPAPWVAVRRELLDVAAAAGVDGAAAAPTAPRVRAALEPRIAEAIARIHAEMARTHQFRRRSE